MQVQRSDLGFIHPCPYRRIMPMLLTVLSGLATGFGLIVAIGAQNAFVLRQGVSSPVRIVLTVAAICAASDIVLIAAGVAGVGVLVQAAPLLLVILRFAGASFLIGYGLLAARRVFRPSALVVESETATAGHGGAAVLVATRTSIRPIMLTALAFTWLNPHVYLDTLVLLGSVANQHGPDLRWWWAAGAMLASCLWFTALGLGARLLRPVLARPAAWRVLDALIAVTMLSIGLQLALRG